MVLEAIHPGVSLEEVKAEVSWPLRVKEPLASTLLPDSTALSLLREELDPKGIYLG
jgi:glutaconate CoA-transferase subunit B